VRSFLKSLTPKKVRKAEKFWQLFGNFLKKIAPFWQLLDTFIGNFFGIHRQLVAKPTVESNVELIMNLLRSV